MRAAFKRFLAHTITVEPITGRDRNARAVYDGTSWQCKAHIEPTSKRVVQPGGTEAVARTFIIADTRNRISEQDRIVLPDGSKAEVLESAQVYDPFLGGAVSHSEVYL